MKVTVAGFERKKFYGNDGTAICGYNLFLLTERKGVTGLRTYDKPQFLSDQKLEGISIDVGTELELVYNEHGKVESVEEL